jgi:hypothetical protein
VLPDDLDPERHSQLVDLQHRGEHRRVGIVEVILGVHGGAAYEPEHAPEALNTGGEARSPPGQVGHVERQEDPAGLVGHGLAEGLLHVHDHRQVTMAGQQPDHFCADAAGASAHHDDPVGGRHPVGDTSQCAAPSGHSARKPNTVIISASCEDKGCR